MLTVTKNTEAETTTVTSTISLGETVTEDTDKEVTGKTRPTEPIANRTNRIKQDQQE